MNILEKDQKLKAQIRENTGMADTRTILKKLDDPIDLALCRIWLTQTLRENLNGKHVIADNSENLEYLNKHNDMPVRLCWGMAVENHLVKQMNPEVIVFTDCGWRVSADELYRMFCDPWNLPLANMFWTWNASCGTGWRDQISKVFADGGEEAVDKKFRPSCD